MNKSVLLTVSGTIPGDLRASIADGRRPRADYVEMAASFDADLLDRAKAERETGRFAALLGRLDANAPMAWAVFKRRKRHRVVFTDGEQVGIPYAALTWLTRRRPRHVMIGHLLSPPKKSWLHRALRLQRRVDTVVVYSSAQARYAIDRLRYRPEQVVMSSFMVDPEFWQPDAVDAAEVERPLIAAVGQERRDYGTLVAAVRGMDIDVAIAAVSPWSKYQDSSAGLEIPANVTAHGYDLHALRQLYADASFVVVPLEETDFQAGITTILEAMAMEKAVVCTRTDGQTDIIVDEVNGLYVPPGDPSALRAAIERLISEPATARRLGVNGRRWVLDHADLEAYVAQLTSLVQP